MVPIEKHFRFEKDVVKPKSKIEPVFLEPGQKKPVKSSKIQLMRTQFNSIIKRNRERAINEHKPVDPSAFYRERQAVLAKEQEDDNEGGKRKKKKKEKPTGLDFKVNEDDDDDDYNQA